MPSQDNPADALSRGQLPREFMQNDMWQNGPIWLSDNEQAWPLNPVSEAEIPEQRATVVLSTTYNINLLEKFSSFVRMKRVIAYCLRFGSKSREGRATSEDLIPEELKGAETCTIKLIQRVHFGSELSDLANNRPLDTKSNILSLNPFLDANGILRVEGRLKHASVDFDKKHPVLLPSKNHVTELIIRESHVRLCHAGTQTTLYAIRENYWPLNGRNNVKNVIQKSIKCYRWKPAIPEYPMGNLPKIRVVCARPFENVGVDFCGPFLIKEKKYRNRNKVKIYVAVFVCLVTKAIHLEIVSDLTTEAFLASLKRLFARRGKARAIYSDNATNFVGANNNLKEIFEFIQRSENQKIISRSLVDQGIQWYFAPPRSPHFGGIWEAPVKSFKHHMRRTEMLCLPLRSSIRL